MKSNTRLFITLIAFSLAALTIINCTKAFMKKSTESSSKNKYEKK